MVGIRLIVIMAIVGGLIAYIADKMGSKIGKKKMTIFGLRPKYTSILLTVLSGVLISVLSIVTVTISSESARTALFGMDKLQKELKSLNDEKDRAAEALIEASGKVQKQNETIAALDKEIKNSTNAKEKMEFELASMNAKYDSAQEEVKNLSDARVKLTNEISDLEKTTEGLRQGIINMREGQLYYRAGEVVYAAVLRGAMNIEQNKDQVAWLLNNANQAALQRLGDQMPDKPVQVIWISEEFVTDALNVLNKNKGDYLCRVRTIANIMVGELVVCELEMLQNKLIYNDEEEVMTKTYDFSNGKVNPDMVIMDFLTGVNHKAVAAGVLPDPVTGKVGNLDAEVMVLAANQIKNCNGKFTLTAYTRGKVTTAGPVRIGLRVKQEKKYE
ncbi:MAG: DUF3084 domain-containing protein [Phascolarctobacterium sp.]|nr:DUF3084 domain-containing protein [Phascolarctobacterium sp.]